MSSSPLGMGPQPPWWWGAGWCGLVGGGSVPSHLQASRSVWQQVQLSDAAEPQITPCPLISFSITGHPPRASPDVCLYQMSMRFSVFIESLLKSSSWSGMLIVHFIWVPYHVQNVPGTIRRHKSLRKHSLRGRKLTVAWRRHSHRHLQTFAEHNQLVGMTVTAAHQDLGDGVVQTEDLMLAWGDLLKSDGCSRLFAH